MIYWMQLKVYIAERKKKSVNLNYGHIVLYQEFEF